MPQALDYIPETASQTAGPYVHIGLAPGAAGFEIFETELGADIAGPDAPGERIRVEGVVYDGTGTPVRDVLIEVWQADAAGIYPHPEDPRAPQASPGFRGWGRVLSDFDSGIFSFETVKPGAADGAPHLNLWLVARGINIGLHTRMYFAEEADANAADPVLGLVEQEARRATLVASRTGEGDMPTYRFDIRLQGDGETVFFDL